MVSCFLSLHAFLLYMHKYDTQQYKKLEEYKDQKDLYDEQFNQQT